MLTSDFIVAGKAIFTVDVPESFRAIRGNEGCKPHYTFQVKHKKANGPYGETWFISLLAGPNNEDDGDYTYLGLLCPQEAQAVFTDLDAGRFNAEQALTRLRAVLVRLTGKSRLADNSWPVRILRRVLARLWRGELAVVESHGWKVHHEGRCGKCGRRLTVPESIETGLGPECSGKGYTRKRKKKAAQEV